MSYRTRSRTSFGALLLIVGVALLSVVLRHTKTPTAAPTTASGAVVVNTAQAAKIPDSTALLDLSSLSVKGRAPKTGYSRAQFGDGWADTNGCDTRNDILHRDLTQISLDTKGCEVLKGVLNDPYTGTVINFVHGQETSSAVQIDHVVALGDAWQTGAQQLSMSSRTQLANDPLELSAVDGPSNDQKGDSDAASWLPPNKADRCDYVAKQILVKQKYSLWVTQAEHDAMQQVLSGCSGQSLFITD
jgi:hypothetical protein